MVPYSTVVCGYKHVGTMLPIGDPKKFPWPWVQASLHNDWLKELKKYY
jgi:hypothetical protein